LLGEHANFAQKLWLKDGSAQHEWIDQPARRWR